MNLTICCFWYPSTAMFQLVEKVLLQGVKTLSFLVVKSKTGAKLDLLNLLPPPQDQIDLC